MTGIFEVASPESLLRSNYSLVLLGILLIALQYLVIAYYVIKVRIEVYPTSFMKQFNQEHQAAFPHQKYPPKLGYPDTGCGKYSSKLSYPQWYKFNCAQRIHLNYLEGLALMILASLLAGLHNPLSAFIIEVLYFVGRGLYSVGYMKGADYRVTGAGIYQISQFVQIYFAVRGALSIVA